jgi:salicylate hydroxylase
LVEQAPALREVGAGIQISPNGTRILHRLGLADELARVGVRPRALEIYRWDDGSMIARHVLAGECERNFGAPYYHFHRAELLDLLVRAIPEGIVQLHHQCIGVTQDAEHVEVRFHDGVAFRALVGPGHRLAA